MAEIWGMALVAGVGYLGAKKQSDAAKRGADATGQAAADATAEQRRQYDLTRSDQMPFLQAGYDDLERQNAFLNGDMSGFENNAGYLFTQQQGLQAADRGAAAGAGYRSGGADVDRMNYAAGLANQTADSYWAKLAGRTGQGFNSANSLGAFGANAANQIGANAMNAANSRASSYATGANAWSNYGNSLAGAVNYGIQNNWGRR